MRKKRAVNVLLVQNDPELAELTKKCITIQGDTVVETALSSSEALKKINLFKPDVIVFDISMESQTSLDFLRSLRESGCAVPFISFAYNDESDIVLKSLDLGANGFVYKDKPTVYEELKKLIDTVIRDRKLLNDDS